MYVCELESKSTAIQTRTKEEYSTHLKVKESISLHVLSKAKELYCTCVHYYLDTYRGVVAPLKESILLG